MKLSTMEVESKSAENWTIFWNLFNLLGCCVDEGGEITKALKVA